MMEDTLDFDATLGQILSELDQSDLQELNPSALADLESADLGSTLIPDPDQDMELDDFKGLANLFGTNEEQLWETAPSDEATLLEPEQQSGMEPLAIDSQDTAVDPALDVDNVLDFLDQLPVVEEEDVDLNELFGSDEEGLGGDNLVDSLVDSLQSYPLDDEITLALQQLPPSPQLNKISSEPSPAEEPPSADSGDWTLLWEEVAKTDEEDAPQEPLQEPMQEHISAEIGRAHV